MASMSQPGPSPSPAVSDLPKAQIHQYESGQTAPTAQAIMQSASFSNDKREGFLPEPEAGLSQKEATAAATAAHQAKYGTSSAATAETGAGTVAASMHQLNGEGGLGNASALLGMETPFGVFAAGAQSFQGDKAVHRDLRSEEESLNPDPEVAPGSLEEGPLTADQGAVRSSDRTDAEQQRHSYAQQQSFGTTAEQLVPPEGGQPPSS